MPLPAIPVGLPFTTEAPPHDMHHPLIIAILPFVIISFLLLSYFLALISPALLVILLPLFHIRLLYYTREIGDDKNVTTLCSVHEVGYSVWSLLSS